MKVRIGCVLYLVFGSAMALHAQGIVLVQQQTRAGKTTVSQYQSDGTHIRVEANISGQNMAFVHDDTTQVTRVFNLDQKTYMEFQRGMTDQQKLGFARLQQQAKPQPQTPEVDKAVARNLPVPSLTPPASVQYRQVGSDRTSLSSCTRYEGYQGVQKVAEICVADPKDLGVTAGDFEIAQHLGSFVEILFPQAANQIVFAGTVADHGFSGIPVRRTVYVNSQIDSVTEVQQVRRQAVAASVFDIPAGFTRQGPAVQK